MDVKSDRYVQNKLKQKAKLSRLGGGGCACFWLRDGEQLFSSFTPPTPFFSFFLFLFSKVFSLSGGGGGGGS